MQQAPLHTSASDIPTVFLRLPDVMRVTRLGRSTIYRLVADGTFPKPVQLAPRAVAWRREDIDGWTATRPVVAH
jgi:prophage regulatory protein